RLVSDWSSDVCSSDLLGLLLTRVAREESGLLQRRAQLLVELEQRTCDAETQRPGLTGDAAALNGGGHVVDEGFGVGVHQALPRGRAQTARVARVAVVKILSGLVSGHDNLVGVDDDHEVA